MKKLIIYLIPLLFLLSSCAPAPVFRIFPESNETAFYQGMEYVQHAGKSLVLSMGYYRHLDNKFIMDVEIINNSDSTVYIDPLQFNYDAYEQYSDAFPADTGKFLANRTAFNPEVEMIQIDKQLAREEAAERTDQTLFLIGQGISVASEIAADSPEEREEISENRRENYRDQQIENMEYRYSKRNLADRREVWEMEALRRTDLLPGEHIRGFVFFENQPDAGLYILRFKGAGLNFETAFGQIKYKP